MAVARNCPSTFRNFHANPSRQVRTNQHSDKTSIRPPFFKGPINTLKTLNMSKRSPSLLYLTALIEPKLAPARVPTRDGTREVGISVVIRVTIISRLSILSCFRIISQYNKVIFSGQFKYSLSLLAN